MSPLQSDYLLLVFSFVLIISLALPTDSDYDTLKDQIHAHIVGQERDGTVLVAWNDKSPNVSTLLLSLILCMQPKIQI
jgi:hypothetical protein